ncbi:hypothetical protein [Achromobacter xylosoxidans]|uniref:hypothetical protein n=1 Tax=Alcaligenes xylosoxydans xylosoxydans TaxID=85698 RepID=UPI001EEB3732|nr:hypothetical protein [Achromobacter xylosoxidans]
MTTQSYWSGHAPGYSLAVERAFIAFRAAEAALLESLKRSYPLDTEVRVVHHRGSFLGVVTGWDVRGVRIVVCNKASGKCAKWWAAHVELATEWAGSDAGGATIGKGTAYRKNQGEHN